MSVRIARNRLDLITNGTPDEAAEELWRIYNDESIEPLDYNYLVKFIKIVRKDWREFIEDDEPICGYKGDPVCYPPDCSGACPTNMSDLRPSRLSDVK